MQGTIPVNIQLDSAIYLATVSFQCQSSHRFSFNWLKSRSKKSVLLKAVPIKFHLILMKTNVDPHLFVLGGTLILLGTNILTFLRVFPLFVALCRDIVIAG